MERDGVYSKLLGAEAEENACGEGAQEWFLRRVTSKDERKIDQTLGLYEAECFLTIGRGLVQW